MSVKEHYENHLGHFYSWMAGDFQLKCNEFRSLLTENSILPSSNKLAIDLGAGHGLQSIPLAELGFKVLAIDFNQHLLNELEGNAKDLNIITIKDDIKNAENFRDEPELIVCCGDTLSHLNDKTEIKTLLSLISNSLGEKGKLILSFRDYSNKLTGIHRFIPVKSDENKILTCILEYEDEFVIVNDLLHEKVSNEWQQKISSYKKVRLLPDEILAYLEEVGMTIIFNKFINRMVTMIAVKN